MLSPFLIPHRKSVSHTFSCFYEVCPRPPASLPWHPPTLGHWALMETRASPPIDAQGHPLLHIMLEPWVPLCVLLGWWFRPWELWLVDIVLPMGLQTPFAPSLLSLSPPLGTLWSVQWLASSIHLCICQALEEALRRELYQAPVSVHFLALTIGPEFVDCLWDASPGGAVSGWHLLKSAPPFVSAFCYPF